MSLKTILVFLDERDYCDSTLRAAVKLAVEHEAHLIGIAIQRPFQPYVSFYADLAVSYDIDEWLLKHENERVAELRAMFDDYTKAQDIVPEWRSLGSHPDGVTAVLLQQTAAAELLIIGAGTDVDAVHPMMRDRSAIVTGSACPVLCVPNDDADKPIGKNVLVAWDGSVQASRSVFRLTSVLSKANRVWLHRINSVDERKNHADDITRDLANALSRKGIELEIGFSDCKAIKVGQELLRVAVSHGADSIVMGAYAHSRVRDLVLGGVTRHIIANTTIPVFLNP